MTPTDQLRTLIDSAFPAKSPGVTDSDLLAEAAALEEVGRMIDARRVDRAAEIAARSARERGDDSLARKNNFTSAAALLAALTGVSIRTARERIKLGDHLHTTTSLSGLCVPAEFETVREAFTAGAIGVDAASVITAELTKAQDRIGRSDAAKTAETWLVGEAATSTDGWMFAADEIRTMTTRLIAHLDPDGEAPALDKERARNDFWVRQRSDGRVIVHGDFDSFHGATWLAAVEPACSPRVRFVEHNDDSGDADTADTVLDADHDTDRVDPVLADPRTRGQRLADYATDLISKAAGLPGIPKINGAAPTVNIHVQLADLERLRGVGWIDGVERPVPVRALDRLLCFADIIPTVFGQGGEILHHGKTKRCFTAKQNRALAARDGGCVWPGCDRPPSWCESHHVEPWVHEDHPGGRTDIDNAVLLCSFHHDNVHRSEWKLVMINGVPHIIPPETVDWTRTPRRVGRQRAHPTTLFDEFPEDGPSKGSGT